MKYEVSRFFCLNCGNETIPCVRKSARRKEKFHRKALYCPHCKNICNAVECKNDFEVTEFKQNFAEGMFTEEAKSSIEYIKTERGCLI